MAKKEKESPSTSLDYLHWWEDNTKPKQPHTFGNTISAIKSGIGNAYDMMDLDKELNGLWEEYNVNPNTTPERKKEIESLFVDKYKQAKALAQEQQDKVDWLQEDPSKLAQLGSHAFSAGTSLNSMVTQYGIQGASALLGGIVGGVLATPETGGLGTLAGAKAGASAGWNASALPASMYANYNDAEQAAAAVRERVMKATGDAALAQQAYKEALAPNLAAVAPSVIVDALTSKYVGGAIGKLAGKGAKVGKAANRMADMMEAARQTRLARGLQRVADTPFGTMAGRAANFIDEFDLPQKAGSWVAGKTNIPALGKLTRGALQFAGEEASEVFQEGEQGVSEDIAYENALYKSDPTKYAKPEGWTANRIGNWVNSEEGRRTIVDTLVGTGLTAGLATGISGFARLDNGYNNRNNLRNVENILAEQQEGGILYSADPEVNSQMKNTIGARYHLNEEQTSALSPEQVIRLSLEDESERAQANGMSAEEASTYAINKYINKRLGFAGRPDYTSEASERFFSKYGIKGTEGLTSIEKRRQEEQEVLKQQPTVAKQAHPDTFSSEPKSYIEERKAQAQGGQGIEQEQQSKGSTGILSKLPQIWHDNWVRREVATTGTNDEYENNTALYDNKVTGKVVRITEMNGQLFVSDVTPKNTKDAEGNPVDAAKTNKFGSPVSRGSRGGQKFTMNKKGLEALNKFFLDNKTNVKELSQESDEQQQAALPPDPNRRRVLIWSANDLANFYRNNSDLMSEDTFMKMTDVLMAYGNNNIPIDLDLERDNNGIVGQTTSEPVQQGVIRAVVHLYMGADAITVLHEFAHVGYDMKSEHEKKLFNAMAQMTQEGFVADVLRKSFNYYADKTNDEIFAMIRQAVQTKDGNVWKDIQSAGVLRQTINIINNEADPDKIQEACEERYAWEFTLWYAEGYLKGRKPDNRMTAMLQRDCRTLGKALKLIGSVAERLQSDGWQAVSGKSMVSMFEEMNNRLYETGDPNVRRAYGGLSRQVQGGYQLNPEVFNNPERRLYTNPLETAMPYSPQVTSMPMQFGTQSQMQMPYNPQATSMPMNYGNPMENTMQQSVPQQAQSMPFGAEMQMANAYPNNTYVPNFTSNIPNFQLQSNPEEGIEGARQNLKNMSNKELIDYAESLRGVDPYSFEKQQVMEEMNRRGLSGKFARREENREVGAYTGEQTSREIMKPETIADMGDAEMNALADMLIEQYNSNLKELGRLMDTSYENAEGDPATQRFIERLRKVVFDKLYDRNRRGMPEGSRQEETQERGEPEKTKAVVHRNKYTQVSDEEAGKILNKAEHGDEEAQKQWESLPFNQRRRVKGEADVTEQQMKEQTKKAAETGKPTYTTGRQMREGLQASPFKESRPNEFSDSLENERRSGVRDIVRKISEMSPEEREKYLQDPKFEENSNYKQAKEIYLESLKPHQALRGKKGELIGRQIESVTRSKIAVEMIEEAFPDGLPSDLSEWRDITSSSNVDGEKGWQIYNKLFNAGIKQSQLDGMSIIVHRSGLVGCVITKSGKAFPTALVSNKYKRERVGLFSQMLLMMHAMPKVKTLTLPTRNIDRTVLVNRLALYQRAGFDIVGFNLQDGRIYLRNSNVEGAIKTKNDKLKWKGLAVGRYKEKQKEIKLGTIPLFRTQQEMSDYYNWLSDKEEPLTRKQQENIWDSVTRSIRNFPMTSDKQLRALIKLVDSKLQTDTSSSKMLARTKLLYSLLREAAQEELNSRKGKYNYNDENTVLNNLADADELKFRRSEMVKEGNAAADQFKAQELFDDATARFTQEENEKENEPTEIEEHFAKDGVITSPKQSVAVEDISMDSFDRLIQSAKQYGIAEDLTKDLKDTFFALQESKRNDEPQEKLKDLEAKFSKLQKSFMNAMQEFSKKIEEAAEEYDKEETDALVDEKQADKKGAPTVRIADDSLRGDITKYNYDDLCRIAMADLLVGEEGKETLYKGLSEDEYITPTEVRRIIGALARKYDSPNIEGIREGLIFRELTEQEKRQIGRVFRKLYRMKQLMDGRFKQGLYGQRGSSSSEEWHIFGHAFAFRRWFSGFYAGNAYGFNALKRIMDNNDIPMYLYAFDEKDMATPLSDEQAQQYRTRVKKITRELTTLRAKRLSEKKNAKKVEYDREIATRENERMEMMTQLWAHGKDINGDGSYSAEEDIFNRDARQRSWIRKFGYTLGRIDLKKKPRQQTTEQEQKELNEEINREINNKPKEESPLSRKIVVNINSDNVERARIATEKRNREEQAVADKEWAEKKSAEEQELYDYMNGNQEVMSFLKKPIKKPEDILRFNAMNTIAENASEEMFDRVEEEMDKFLEDLKQMGAFGLGNYEEDEGYKRYTQIKNKLNEQLNKVHDRITGKTQPRQTKQKKQTTATENKQTAQTNTAEQGSTIEDSKLKGRILQAIKHYYKTGEIDMSKIIYDGETVTPEQQKIIDSRLANAKKKYAEKNKGNAEPAPTPTPEPTTNKKNATNKKNKSTETTAPTTKTTTPTTGSTTTNNKTTSKKTKTAPATKPQQNPQPVEEETKSSSKKYSAPKGKGELVQSSTPEGEMDKRTKPKGAKEIFGNLYYPDSSDFKQRLKEADLNGTNQKEKSVVMKMVLEEVGRIGRNYKISGFGVAEASLDKLERIIDSIEGKNGTSKDVIKRINALRDEIKQYRDRKVTYKENAEKDNIDELSSDDGSDISEEGSKTRNMEVDTIPETPVEQNRDVYSITFTKDALAESEENRKRAKDYEREDKYWKKEKNADGSVTFTRQKPQPHHTKTITYSGMHGKEVSKKPLSTVSEGLSKAWDYWKEKAYNVQASIKDLAEMVGAPESWMEFVVTKDMGSLAQTAIERGIVKHNSKDKERTVALMDIANAFKGEKEQWNFINYCVAYRVLHDLTPKGIEQKMKPNEARDIIRQVESSPDAAKYKEWREKFTEYNKELLHVLVDGNMITEQEYQTLIKEHPNFIPLSKDMSDFDGAMDFLHTHRDLINVQSPLHRIGTSMKEIKNPIIEMQKRTFDYYQRAAQNKAALVFIDKIVNKITTLANGDEVMLNQAILHKLKPQYNKNGTIKDISDANKGIFYVMRDGKKEFYQLSDASVYHALRAMSPQHMEGFGKFVDFVARKPSQLLRTMATITFDFALGNLVRDTGEAFVTSRHGFVPFYDSLWGMWQMYNDTQWFKEYNSQVGDMTSRLKEDKRIAGVEQSIEDQLMRIPVLGHMALAMKVFNEYMEQGTRIGEYKNARMGYKGLAGRLSKDGVGWITDKDLQKAEKSQTYAAYRAKDITLNFLQRGEWGGWLNRYTTFLNAAMQGQYKIIDTLSEIKNNREGFRNEMLLKASLIAFLGFMTGYNGGDDDDYEEAPDWERDNYYVQGNGLRTPKDQLFGKLIGNPFEQLGYMMKKGKLKNDAFKTFEGSIKEFLLPDNLTPVFINLWLGLSGGKDSFKGKQIVPEYMKEKIGYLQKDLSTSNMAADISRFTYDFFGVDVSAKKLDWGLKQFMSNTAKYVDKIYDTGREEITGQKSNRSGHMYLEEDSKGASDYLNFTTGNNILDGILDLGRMAFGKKFIQNQTTFDSMQDFNEEYLRLKRLSSDEERFTKEDEKKYKTFYEPAFKKIKENYQKLSAISKDSSLDPDKKTEKQRPIVKQSIDLARWALKNGGK